MYSTLISLTLLASTAFAVPHKSYPRQAPGAQNVVYWGQNGGGTIENNDLSTYCTSTSGIDIIVLAFLNDFGNGNDIPSATGGIGQSCAVSSSGEGQNCDALATAISECQAAGVKIMLSLGSAISSWGLSGAAEAETIANNLWQGYGNVADGSVPRPFGSTFVNGFDFDIESNNGDNQYFQYMIQQLRTNFATDPDNTYYITGAPQCPIPEPNMGEIITSSQFDYLWVQFYNNNDYAPDPCSLGFNSGNAPFNYNDWVSYISGTPSANAKIFIGAPAAPDAATGTPSGETYYITPDQMADFVSEYKSASNFGGIMLWSAGFSDSNVVDGCTYAQNTKEILLTGTACDGTPPDSTPTNTNTKTATGTATSATATSTATGTVGNYDQCGGTGYTGATACADGWVCTEISSAYSQCDPPS